MHVHLPKPLHGYLPLKRSRGVRARLFAAVTHHND